MTGQEKPKRKALHRGLDDIVNRDVSLTSRLLGRMKPPTREPLEVPERGEEPHNEREASPGETAATHTSPEPVAPLQLRSPAQSELAAVHRLDETRAEPPTHGIAADEADTTGTLATAAAAAVGASPSPITFDEFVARWGFVLRSGGRAGKLRICQALYENTYALGQDTFLTSYEKLANSTGLEKKQCAINIKQLESLGFVERVNIFNTATRQGTEFRLHLEQLPPGDRRSPLRHHFYDEDLPG